MFEQATLAAKVNEILSNRDLRANEMIYAIKSILPAPALPTDEKPATTPTLPDGWRLALHQGFGRIIVTNATTHRGGYVGCLLLTYDYPMGFEWRYFTPGELTYIHPDQEAETLSNWYPLGPDWEFYTPPI